MNIRRILRARQEHGTIGLIRHVFRHKFPVHVSVAYIKNSDSNICTVPGLRVDRYSSKTDVDEGIFNELRAIRGEEMVREVDKLFSKGCELWIGRLEGKLAGICWSRRGKKRSDYFVPLGESDATILSCFVFPDFRGRKIYPTMLETMVNVMLSQDQTGNVYIDCKSWNTASIRGIQKAGFISIGKAVRMVLFNRVWILWNRCKK